MQCLLIISKTCLIGLLLFTISCQRREEKKVENISDQRTKVLEEAQAKRADRAKQLKGMDTVQLANELESESQKGVEPFNSTSYAEMISRGENAASGFAALLTKSDRASLLGLLALRKISSTRYASLDPEFRVSVLIDALKTSKYFNSWGLPHLYWEEAAKAIVEEGAAAQRPLMSLLSDKRDAPVWGSEDSMEYKRYKYRVCDYAWALLNEIKPEKVAIPVDPAERDKIIQKILG